MYLNSLPSEWEWDKTWESFTIPNKLFKILLIFVIEFSLVCKKTNCLKLFELYIYFSPPPPTLKSLDSHFGGKTGGMAVIVKLPNNSHCPFLVGQCFDNFWSWSVCVLKSLVILCLSSSVIRGRWSGPRGQVIFSRFRRST